jgi:hypothetical protein
LHIQQSVFVSPADHYIKLGAYLRLAALDLALGCVDNGMFFCCLLGMRLLMR